MLPQRTGRRRRENRLRPFAGPDGRLSIAELVAAAPFPVYGLEGEPLRLRLRSPGWGGKGAPATIDRVHFGYVAGRPYHPERAVEVTQGPAAHADIEELRAIESLVRSYAPKERREEYFYRGDIHQDWNLERVSLASSERATILVGGGGPRR